MKIIPKFERLQSGEINSRVLGIEIENELADYKIRLGFVTPMGRVYISEEQETADGKGEFALPSGLLDGKGLLLAQILVTKDDSFVMKSPVYEFPVFSSVDDMSCPTVSDETLKSISMIFELIDKKSDIGHSHNDVYYTERETDALLSQKSDILHTHGGVYLTENEIKELLGDVTAASHDHDERYYTDSEVDSLLSKKSDSSHSHSYGDIRQKPSINGIEITNDTHINGLMYRGILTSADDLNEIFEDGVYVYSTSSLPANAPFANAAVIEVFGAVSDTTQKIQRAYRYGESGYAAFRPLYNGWKDWSYIPIIKKGTATATTNNNGNVGIPNSNISNMVLLACYVSDASDGTNYRASAYVSSTYNTWMIHVTGASNENAVTSKNINITYYYTKI